MARSAVLPSEGGNGLSPLFVPHTAPDAAAATSGVPVRAAASQNKGHAIKAQRLADVTAIVEETAPSCIDTVEESQELLGISCPQHFHGDRFDVPEIRPQDVLLDVQ